MQIIRFDNKKGGTELGRSATSEMGRVVRKKDEKLSKTVEARVCTQMIIHPILTSKISKLWLTAVLS